MTDSTRTATAPLGRWASDILRAIQGVRQTIGTAAHNLPPGRRAEALAAGAVLLTAAGKGLAVLAEKAKQQNL